MHSVLAGDFDSRQLYFMAFQLFSTAFFRQRTLALSA
jgi:hypothetical protein